MKNVFYIVYVWFWAILNYILRWFGLKGGNIMQTGELVVTGSDRVEILLCERPDSVKVYFVDDQCDVPCNHGHHDHLSWFVHKKEHHHHHNNHHHYTSSYTLTIKWHVHNVRKIVWAVHY
jgi:hypothetical protein